MNVNILNIFFLSIYIFHQIKSQETGDFRNKSSTILAASTNWFSKIQEHFAVLEPPVNETGKQKLNIDCMFRKIDILEVSTEHNTILLSLVFDLTWKDHRLNFSGYENLLKTKVKFIFIQKLTGSQEPSQPTQILISMFDKLN